MRRQIPLAENDPAAAPPNAPRRSFRWRFSLRALLLLLLLISLGIGLPRQRSIAQHQAARRFQTIGAEFVFDSEEQVQSTLYWLVFGDNRYDFVYRISFNDVTLSARDVAQLRLFPELDELRLTGCGLNAQATSKLGSLHNMRGLRVEGGSLQELEDVAWEQLNQLEWLVLEDIDLSQLTCRRLSALQNCTTLSLVSSRLTDAQLQQLKMPQLNILRLAGSQLSDAGLTFLAHATELQFFTVNDSQVSGSGLRLLHPAAELLALNLERSAVNSAGLSEIAKLRGLTSLQVRSTPLTPEDIVKFKAAHPKCTVLADRK